MKNASERKLFKKLFRLRTIITLMLFTILFLHIVSFIPTLNSLIMDYKQAKHVFSLNNISDYLYTSVGNYGFERGRVNVVLNDAGPVEKMEKNRQFIIARRAEGNEALNNAIRMLSEISTNVETQKAIEEINRLTPTIEKRRKETAIDLLKPKDKRVKGLAEIWFSTMTDYIESIEKLLVGISSEISDADGLISRYSSLKHETLALRNTAGPEMSILSATMLSEAPLNPKLAKKK